MLPVMFGPNITGSLVGDHECYPPENPQSAQRFWSQSGALSYRLDPWEMRSYATLAQYMFQHCDVLVFDASKSNAVYNNSSTVQPAASAVQYLIKY